MDAAGFAVLALFAAALPLIVAPAAIFDDPDVLPKVAAGRLCACILAVLVAVRFLQSGRLAVRRSRLDVPVAALVVSAALSTSLSVSRPLSLVGAYTRYEGLLTIATYAALFWLALQFIQGPRQARWLLRAMLAGAAVESALAAVQALASSTGAPGYVISGSAAVFDGVARAAGTMANANNLAIWLAMLLPAALYEAFTATERWIRAAAVVTVLLMAVALAVTFSRSAWAGLACGLIVMAAMALRRGTARRTAAIAAASVAVAAVVLTVIGAIGARLGVPVLDAAAQRLGSAFDLSAGGSLRLHIYADSVRIAAQRPLTGFGPDTFGLVYPSRASGDWLPGLVLDKAHSDLLQVAVAQGLLGVAATVWLLTAFATAAWRSRGRAGVVAVAACVVAYEVGIQLNFAWFPVTAAFWVVLAVGAVLTESTRTVTTRLLPRPARVALAAFIAGIAVCAALFFVALPLLANAAYGEALQHAPVQRQQALSDIATAEQADPSTSQYAAYAGDLQADLVGERPGPVAHLRAAKSAYERALADGDFYPAVPIRLAFVDVALGLRDAALSAARTALALDPYGVGSKLVRQLGG